MRKRILGQTGITVSEIGLGAWPLGGAHYGHVETNEATKIVEQYISHGGNFIDTARVYGQSEEVIGSVIKNITNREDLIIATKTTAGETDETIPQIRKDLEQSLRNLKSDYVDLFYLHHPPETIDGMQRAIDEMETLKREGKIHSIGASIKGLDVTDQTEALCTMYIGSGRVDVIQVVYSILRQRLQKTLIAAHDNGIGVVARTTLESGFLTGKYLPGHIFPKDDHRSRYDQGRIDDILSNIQILQKMVVKPPFESLTQIALKFALQEKSISSILVGAKTPASLEHNISIAEMPKLKPEMVNWIKKQYGDFTNRASSH